VISPFLAAEAVQEKQRGKPRMRNLPIRLLGAASYLPT